MVTLCTPFWLWLITDMLGHLQSFNINLVFSVQQQQQKLNEKAFHLFKTTLLVSIVF